MSFAGATGLHARVLNCLQTILELESDLERVGMRDDLLEEFTELKGIMAGTDDLNLREDDVERIERATAGFLHELEMPLAMRNKRPRASRLQ